jgi:hypothetical protein
MAKRDVNAILATPAYPFVEAAHYLNIPLSTLRAWCLGQGHGAGAVDRRRCLVETAENREYFTE